MKKLLTFLTLLTLSIGVSWAAEYVKVTSTSDVTAGTYLIVYEDGNRVFDGSRTSDATNNYQSVTISNNKIVSTSTIDTYSFSISEYDENGDTWSIKSASGYYIGNNANSNQVSYNTNTPYQNSIEIDQNGDAIIKGVYTFLRYNATSGQDRFRYFKENSYSNYNAIQLYKKVEGSSSDPKLYIIGQVNGNDGNDWWNSSTGTELIKGSDGKYSATVYFTGAKTESYESYGNWVTEQVSYFIFTQTLPPGDNDRMGGEGNGDYWLTSSNMEQADGHSINGSNAFRIPQGIYTLTVDLDNKKLYVKKETATITFNPESGSEIPVGSSVEISSNVSPLLGIQYNTDGSSNYQDYSNGVTLNENKTIYARVAATGSTNYTAVYATGQADYTIQEVNPNNIYTLVESSADLVAGCEYLIVGSTAANPYSAILGPWPSTGNYATAVKTGFTPYPDDKKIILNDDCAATPLTLGGNADGWTFYNGSGYIAYTSDALSGSNYLWLNSSPDADGSTWTINTSLLATGSNALIVNVYNYSRKLQYNNDRFAGYTTNQSPVSLFKKVSSTPTNKTATPVIAPDSKDVKGGLLEGITIAPGEENTNPAIWYTTDGSDPSDANNAERKPYTVPFNIQVTQGGPQTVKAIAIEEGKDPSNIATVTYMFKNPDAPTFEPDPAIVQTGDFTITISSPDGGVIYYILDPEANEVPSNSQEVIDANNAYDNGVAVSGNGTHTIYAVAVLNGLKSTIANATYTVIETGAEGDWTLVTSADQIKAGREYIIVNSDRDRAIKSGALETKRFYSVECKNNVVFGPNFATATVAGSDVRIFGFETEDNNIYMKDADGSRYYNFSSDVSATTTAVQPVYISMSDGFVYIKGAADATRSLAYNTDYGNYFGIYATPTSTTGSQHPIYLYYRDIKSMYLADIEATENGGVVGTRYAIADEYLVAVEARDVTIDGDENSYAYVWCKDDNNVTNKLTPAEGVIDFMIAQGEQPSNPGWDQSNWVVLRFKNPSSANDPKALKGHKVTGIVGTYVDATNYMIDVESYTQGDAKSYSPNVYCVANFNSSNWGANGVQQKNDEDEAYGDFYFFMTPKVQEVCHITFAAWNGETFTVPASSDFTKNTLTLGWDYNQNSQGTPVSQEEAIANLHENNPYQFNAIVQASTGSKGAITGGSKVYPTNLTGGTENDVPTAINGVVVNGEVKSVKYVNVAGMVSDVPFQGVNIVVTEYTDGSRTTTKMLKK